MESFLRDMRFAARLLAKNPGFTALAVLMLAIGIGINSTVFSFMDCLVLRPIAAQNPDQLVRVYQQKENRFENFSYPVYQDIAARSRSFSGLIPIGRKAAVLDRKGEMRIINAEWVSHDYFSVLGIRPSAGQLFSGIGKPDLKASPPVVISHGMWKKDFGSDPAIVGKAIILNKRNAIIVGVAPASFNGLNAPMSTEVWIPLELWSYNYPVRKGGDFELLVGRLKPGIDEEQARADLSMVARSLAVDYPATDRGASYLIQPFKKKLWQKFVIGAAILSGPLLILLICCANVSGMGLARAEGRRQEIALRLALGSDRRRIIRQLLTESLLLSLAGGAVGLLLAWWLIGLQSLLLPPFPVTIELDLRIDGRVLLFTLLAALAASLAAGLPPAVRALKAEAIALHKPQEPLWKRSSRPLSRNLLVVGQVALSLILVVATGLLLKTLLITNRIDTGLDSEKKLLIVGIATPATHHSFYVPAIEKIKTLPRIKNASWAMRLPLSDSGAGVSREITIPGREAPEGRNGFAVKYNVVGSDYFRTVGTRIRAGREFSRIDETPGQRTVVISEAMAEKFWPGTDPIGRFINADGRSYQIIGIAGDVKIAKLHEAREPYLYFSMAQVPRGESCIIVEAAGDPLEIAPAVKKSITSVNSSVIFLYTDTTDTIMSQALYEERTAALVSAFLGVLGVILTAIGLYGIVSFITRRRTGEIGIRLALGARSVDIRRLVLRQGVRISLAGIAIGLVVSFFAMRMIAGMLYGVAPTDAWTFVISAVFVFGISVLAGCIPAYRAGRMEPMPALRHE